MSDQDLPSTPAEDRTNLAHDRRRGPRRADEPLDVPFERRQTDRRKRKPGLAGLFGAIFGRTDEPTEN
ncbi:MAG TPA: hypothetical protein VII52_06580 [Gemmatimonadaceae bacterium]|jgi:hypothetical protein